MPSARPTDPQPPAANPRARNPVVARRHRNGRLIAFALDGDRIVPADIAVRLGTVPGVTAIAVAGVWRLPPDQQLRFEYLGRRCVVWEPWGIEGRYWVEPESDEPPGPDLAPLARAFRDHRPSRAVRWLGAVTRLLPAWRRSGADLARRCVADRLPRSSRSEI